MSLTKDQKQKIALGGIMLVGIGYSFIEFLISPVGKAAEQAERRTAETEPLIRAAKAQLKKTEELAAKLPTVTKLESQVAAMIPPGSPVAWFPPRIAEYFKHNGIEKTSARQNGETSEKDIPGFKRLIWAIEVPKADFVKFGKALAELESGEPLAEVQGLDIEVDRDDPMQQHYSLNIINIVRQ